MDFSEIATNDDRTLVRSPYAAKNGVGDWVEGYMLVSYLNTNFGHLESVDDMIDNSPTEGIKRFFEYLRDERILK